MARKILAQFAVKKWFLILVLGCFLSPIIPSESFVSGEYIQKAEAKRYKKKRKKTLDDYMVEQKSSKKWAAIVVDANRGSILYEKNAESRRYPASLTKMMTLYLLFDKLDRKRVSLSSRMRASKKAASQPQTNVSLKPGDTITVKQAIEALIVRSANDVAVVVAEHLAGSESGFARQMNAKAKELGMTRTRFVNPHGLPNSRQVSSAMDMAKLSIALRRDFPHYYKYFRTTSFRFKGKTYKSHNRVLGRLPGVDGLKTGYIRASGFNLATSMTRGKNRLVAVIMGGATSAARDQEMIDMLDRTMVIVKKKEEEERIALAQRKKEEAERAKDAEYAAAEMAKRKQFDELLTSPVEPRKGLNRTDPYIAGKNWAVQVGAFPTIEQAERAAAQAREIAPTPLSSATLDISQVMKGNQVFNRSRMLFLSADQARTACDRLASARKQCMVIRMEN